MVGSRDDPTLLSGKPVRANEDEPIETLPPPSESGAVSQPEVRVTLKRSSRPPSGRALSETERFIEREVIGTGGMGSVIRAYDKDLGRDVAIKILAPELSRSAVEVERFTEEARITGQLEHPYIVPVYEFGSDSRGDRFLCMRLVQGKTLEDTLDAAGPSRLHPDQLGDLLQVFVKICDAVSFAHSRGIIHRDLKPANVMISDFGQVYVMDWGVARSAPRPAEAGRPSSSDLETASDPPGALIGTPSYMAPEQLRGLHDQVDERSDVFALGATLYQILTGQPPRLPKSLRAILVQRAPIDIAPPESVVSDGLVPLELSRIAQKAMCADPAGRYASADDLKGDVERFLRGAWHLPKVRFSAGSVIIREGDPGESAYIIVEGRCCAYRDHGATETVLREMGAGDVFGETAVFSDKPRTASVKALTEVEVMVVTRDLLSNALGLNFWMGSFVRALADRFRDVDERLRQLEHGERQQEAEHK